MRNYFIATLFAIVIIGLISFILGLTAILNSGKCKKPEVAKRKKNNGVGLLVLGSVVMSFFIPTTIYFQGTDSSSSVWMIQLLLFPASMLFLIVSFGLYLTNGIFFLQQGFMQRKEGIYDTESIFFGFVIISLGALMTFCLVMTFVYSVGSFSEGLMVNHKSSSRPNSSSLSVISNYIFSVINK